VRCVMYCATINRVGENAVIMAFCNAWMMLASLC
jgi:hypothetical protein